MACVASEHLRLLDPLGFALRQDSLVAVWQTLQENKLCLAAVRQGEVQTSLLATRQDATDVSADDWGAKRCKILRKDMTQLCSERSDAGWVSARRKTSRPAASSCGSVDAGSRPPKSPRSRSPGKRRRCYEDHRRCRPCRASPVATTHIRTQIQGRLLSDTCFFHSSILTTASRLVLLSPGTST